MSEQIPAGRKTATGTVLDGTVQSVEPFNSKENYRPLTRFYQRILSHAPGGQLIPRRVQVEDLATRRATSSFPFGKLSFIACVLIPALAVSL